VFIIILIIGLLLGSFYNVCIYRIPKGESIINPPSHCTKCGTKLKFLDLFPVISYLAFKGKCRYCGEKISYRYILVEIITSFSFIILYIKFGMTLQFLGFLWLVSILIIITFIDIDYMIIPDGLVILGIVGGVILFALNIFFPIKFYQDNNWWNPLIGAIIGSGFLLLVAYIGFYIYKSEEALGMGDVKLFIPIGLFLGWKITIIALALSIFMCAVSTSFLVIIKILNRKSAIPFGPFIGVGTFLAILYGNSILLWYLHYL